MPIHWVPYVFFLFPKVAVAPLKERFSTATKYRTIDYKIQTIQTIVLDTVSGFWRIQKMSTWNISLMSLRVDFYCCYLGVKGSIFAVVEFFRCGASPREVEQKFQAAQPHEFAAKNMINYTPWKLTVPTRKSGNSQKETRKYSNHPAFRCENVSFREGNKKKDTPLKIDMENVFMEIWRMVFLSKWLICSVNYSFPCFWEKRNMPWIQTFLATTPAVCCISK